MIMMFNRAERRQAGRKIKEGLRKYEDKKFPFARQHREEMIRACQIDVIGGRWYASLHGEMAELLTDYIGHSKNMRPWASKKEASRILAASYNRIATQAIEDGDGATGMTWRKRATSTGACASRLIFRVDAEENLTLKSAKFCHDPLCPVCNWRKSIKATVLLTEAMDRIIDHEDQRLLHLVLTVPNCRLEDLRETFERMGAAFAKMTKQAWWKKRFSGYYAKYEWTISQNPQMIAEGRIVHPHMHVLLTVSPEYFDIASAWMNKVATAFRMLNYSPLRSAGRCASYAGAVCSVRRVLAQVIMDQAMDDGVDVATTRLWRTPYRGRYQRLIKHIDEIATRHRPSADADKETIQTAIKAFATEVSAAGDPLYIDEPEQRVFLRSWQAVYGDSSITDVSIEAVKYRRGSRTGTFHNDDCKASPEKRRKEAMQAAVKEMATYIAKDSDYILPQDPKETDRRVAILREQLTGLHTVSSGGLVKKYIAEVKAEWEADDDDLVHTDDPDGLGGGDCDGTDERFVIAIWNPRMHAYTVVRPGERTEDTFAELRERDLIKNVKALNSA